MSTKKCGPFLSAGIPSGGELGSGDGGSGDGAGEAVRGKVGSTLAQAIRLSPALRADRITSTFFFQMQLELFNLHMTLLLYEGCICFETSCAVLFAGLRTSLVYMVVPKNQELDIILSKY